MNWLMNKLTCQYNLAEARHRSQLLAELALLVLQSVALVDDQARPHEAAAEVVRLGDEHFEGCHHDVELGQVAKLFVLYSRSLVLWTCGYCHC